MATVRKGGVAWPATVDFEDVVKSACTNRLKTRVLTVFGVFVSYPGAKTADSSRTELTSAPQLGKTTPNLL